MHERSFVLSPLEEFAPKLRIPGIQVKVRELLSALKDQQVTKISSFLALISCKFEVLRVKVIILD